MREHDERRARAVLAAFTCPAEFDKQTPKTKEAWIECMRAIRQSDDAAIGLKPHQIQPDDDSPGLYLQCESIAQRDAILALLAATGGDDAE